MKIDTNTPLIDSNVLLDSFTESSQKHQTNDILRENGCYINEFILCEVLNFVQNKFSHYHSIQTEQFIFANSESFLFLPHVQDYFIKASQIRSQYNDCEFSFTDCIILAQAQEYDLHILTKDKRMHAYKHVSFDSRI